MRIRLMGYPLGPNHIPADAISLFESWLRIVDVLEDPDVMRMSAVDEVREIFEKEISDSVQFDIQQGYRHPDDAETSTRERIANMLLKWELSKGRLSAYIRDPHTGERLRLAASADWYQLKSNYVPDIVSDYLDAEEESQRATVIKGEVQRVFFVRIEFEEWFRRTFSKSVEAPAEDSISDNPPSGSHDDDDLSRKRDHRRTATKRALKALYPNGYDGVTLGVITRNVNSWLRERSQVEVSEKTVSRAMKPSH